MNATNKGDHYRSLDGFGILAYMKKNVFLLFLIIQCNIFSVWAEETATLGWQISPVVQLSSLDENQALFLGGEASVIWDHWSLGGAFYHTITDTVWEYEEEEGEYDGVVFPFPRDLAYGGGVLEYSFFPEALLSPYLSLLLGGGYSIVGTISDDLFIIEPRLGVNCRVHKYFKVGSRISYRAALFSDWFPTSWVSGFSSAFYVRVGNYIKIK